MVRRVGGGEEGGEDTIKCCIVQKMLAVLWLEILQKGRRAPYTGTADGIGLGDDGKGESNATYQENVSLARQLFNLTPMGMAFNAGNKLFKGVKNHCK